MTDEKTPQLESSTESKSENNPEQKIVIQTLDFDSKDEPKGVPEEPEEEPNPEMGSESAPSYEDASDNLRNQNFRLIAAILVAILSALFIWWLVS